jgi:hypothetical protein
MKNLLCYMATLIAISTVAIAQNTVVNSLILRGDNGNRLTLTAPPGMTGNLTVAFPNLPAGGTLLGTDATGNLLMGAGDFIQLTEPAGAGGTNWTRLQAGAQASDFTWTLPTTAPTANQVLTATAIAGSDVTLGWTTPSGGGGGGAATETGFSRTTAATSFTTTTLGDVAGLSVSWGAGTSGSRTYRVTLMFDYTTPTTGPSGFDVQLVSLGTGIVSSSRFVLAGQGPLTAFQVNTRVSVDDGNFWIGGVSVPVVYEGYVVVDDNVTGVKVQAALRQGTSQTYTIPIGSAVSYIRVN